MPRKAYIKEHRNLVGLLNQYDIPALRKEAADQTREVKEATGVQLGARGGFGKASGFIRRMMAENALKNKGQYKNAPFKEFFHEGSTMSQKVPFKLTKLQNKSQNALGKNPKPYGASPFIMRHFGTIEGAPFERKRGVPQPTEPFKKKRVRGQKAAAPRAPVPPIPAEPLAPPEQGEEGEEVVVATRAPIKASEIAKFFGQKGKKVTIPPATIAATPAEASAAAAAVVEEPTESASAKEQRRLNAERMEADEAQKPDFKLFKDNTVFIMAVTWLESIDERHLTTEQEAQVKTLLDHKKSSYPSVNGGGGNTSWGRYFPYLRSSIKSVVEERDQVLTTFWLQSSDSQKEKPFMMNPYHQLRVYNPERKLWATWVGRDHEVYHNGRRVPDPEWTGPFYSWEDFENRSLQASRVSLEFWKANSKYGFFSPPPTFKGPA